MFNVGDIVITRDDFIGEITEAYKERYSNAYTVLCSNGCIKMGVPEHFIKLMRKNEMKGYKQMTKSDLKTGMRVVIEDGTIYYVARDIDGFDYFVSNGSFDNFGNYKDNLKSTYKSCLDIVEVWKSKNPNYLNGDVAWERIWLRDNIKEVTMSEVESKFGCKVKIVNKI